MTPTLPNVPVVEAQIVELTNAFRKSNKLADVKPNAMLKAAAQAFADYLAKSGAFSHTADGRQPADRAQAAGYRYCLVAENLAEFLDSRGFESSSLARQTVDGWINSPGHRKNMLTPDATEIGVAVAKAPDMNPKYISVEMFGRPLSMQFSFEVINTTSATVAYRYGEEKSQILPNMVVTHTTCHSDELTFDAAGASTGPTSATTRFEPHKGNVFKIVPAGGKGVQIQATMKGPPR